MGAAQSSLQRLCDMLKCNSGPFLFFLSSHNVIRLSVISIFRLSRVQHAAADHTAADKPRANSSFGAKIRL